MGARSRFRASIQLMSVLSLDLFRRCAGFVPVFVLTAATATIGCAQAPPSAAEMAKEIQQLREEQAETQAELDELKEILAPILSQLPQPFRPQDASVAGSPVMGKMDAPVTMIEFSDLQCPFCERYYQETFPSIVDAYVKTDKVRYVVREFPLSQIHPRAKAASSAALCAVDQDKYWEMRDQILNNRDKLSDDDLAGYAMATGLDMSAWQSCLKTDIYDQKVSTDLQAGAELGVSGTPAFALGMTDPDDPEKILVTKLIEGAYPFDAFRQALDELLESAQ